MHRIRSQDLFHAIQWTRVAYLDFDRDGRLIGVEAMDGPDLCASELGLLRRDLRAVGRAGPDLRDDQAVLATSSEQEAGCQGLQNASRLSS